MEIRDVLPKDAIASIDDPVFGREYFGDPDDEVLVVEGPTPRAYPVRMLSYHEIVNDAVDGRPVAVTWCPICWSGAVYDRRVDGRALTFGVSGKLADDALVMYDRETDSEWKQTSGCALAGEFEGRCLRALPAPMVSYERFLSEYPGGEVLQPVRGSGPSAAESPAVAYDMVPYERYAAEGAFGLYGMRGTGEPRSWEREDIGPKTVVLGVERGDDAVGYPRPVVEAAGGVVTGTVADLPVVVFASDGRMHAFENPGFAFEGAFEADGTAWDPVTGESADGRRLERVPATRLFAFAWQDDHGPDAFYGL